MNGHVVGGIDYSKKLINLAKSIMPNGNIVYDSANNLDIKKKYDIVLSNSVFQYFPNIQYAEDVIDKMLNKAREKIICLDINDKIYEEKAHKIRRGALTRSEYNRKYKAYEHQYYDKELFCDIAKKHNYEIKIINQNIIEYGNNPLRYNIIITK